jgi:phosphate transport system substrate-binding protein
VNPKFSLALALAGVATLGCGKSRHSAPTGESAKPEPAAAVTNDAPRTAPIAIDGSSTVFPISEAMAEEFQKKHAGSRVTVAASGTGGGFKKLCAKEIAIAGASRPIKPTEVDACKASGVEYVELPIAFDGIAVVVNSQNKWVDKMTVAELKKLWSPEAQGKVKTWADIRKGWPKEEIHLFGAGVDSGTYDYFTKAIVGEEHKSRGDYTSSEDDNVLVKGIATDKLALGFFGVAYYAENKDTLKLVPIDHPDPRDNREGHLPAALAPGLRVRQQDRSRAQGSARLRRLLSRRWAQAGRGSRLHQAAGRCLQARPAAVSAAHTRLAVRRRGLEGGRDSDRPAGRKVS